jgi:hypothetical protein
VAGWTGAANRWQLTAIDPKSQVDTVSPAVRAQRNAYWKPSLEAKRGSIGSFGAGLPGPRPEFSVEPGDIWAIATFESFHAFMIDNDSQLIYTEENFRIEHVFRQPAGMSLSSGSLIDAGREGGRIKSPKGDILSPGWLRPSEYSVQLGHKYLMQFSYDTQAGFYWTGQYWDLSSGRVQVEGPIETERAAQGKSAIAGMSVEDLVKSFPSILPDEPKKDESKK